MGFSVNNYTFTGSYEFDLNFALGYAARSDVGCIKVGDPPEQLDFDWIGPARVRISGSSLQVGDTVRFYRTVSKNSLPVDLTQPNRLTREDVETAMLHSIYMVHEVLDGRIGSSTDVSEVVLSTVSDLVTRAVEDTDLLVSKRYPLVIHGSTNYPLLFSCPVDFRSSLSEVTITVEGFPGVPVQYELRSDTRTFMLVDIYPDGSYTVNTTDESEDFVVNKGPIRLLSPAGNYYDGEIAIGINGIDSDIISTTEDFPDFLVTYTTARDD